MECVNSIRCNFLLLITAGCSLHNSATDSQLQRKCVQFHCNTHPRSATVHSPWALTHPPQHFSVVKNRNKTTTQPQPHIPKAGWSLSSTVGSQQHIFHWRTCLIDLHLVLHPPRLSLGWHYKMITALYWFKSGDHTNSLHPELVIDVCKMTASDLFTEKQK